MCILLFAYNTSKKMYTSCIVIQIQSCSMLKDGKCNISDPMRCRKKVTLAELEKQLLIPDVGLHHFIKAEIAHLHRYNSMLQGGLRSMNVDR